MSLFSKKSKGARFVVFDIGSASVGAAVVAFARDMKPNIEYQVRKDITFQKELDYNRFTKSMLTSLNDVAEDITKHTSGVQSISCVLSSPWFISQTNLVTKKGGEFEVTSKLLNEIVSNEEKRLSNSGKTKKFEKMKSGTEIIEKNILNVEVNGYHTQNPIGKITKEMKAAVHVSMASHELLESMRKDISKPR